MATSTIEHQQVRPRERGERRGSSWQPDYPTVICVAAVLGAVTALCEDTTLRIVLWAFLR